MRVVLDIEANSLTRPDKIWVIVWKDIDTGEYKIFRNLTEDGDERERFRKCLDDLRGKPDHLLLGHNLLGYDWPVLVSTLELHPEVRCPVCLDTLILSKLIDYSRPGGHSIEDYGVEFGLPKLPNKDQGFFSQWSQELEDYCKRDVDICHRIYLKYLRYISKEEHKASIELEHNFQLVVNSLSSNGFSFDKTKATKLLTKVQKELEVLDKDILKEFPPKETLIREFIPKLTKHGTISKSSVPRALHGNIHEYEAGQSYRHTKLVDFNPSSHKQVIAVLNQAGWLPVDKTQTHIETERELNRLRYRRERTNGLDFVNLSDKLEGLRKTGWKINETNLATLPEDAPSPARTLAKRILLESRRRTLTEWLGLVQEDSRIHGKYYGIGAWTHRMAHQQPNTANIPTDVKLYGGEMRSLWRAPRNRLLVGVDAEGIQLRIFAHYIDDKEFTDALVKGDKVHKTDPHSLNQRILGRVCGSRQIAKRFIYALLLGAGISKLAQILECSVPDAQEALDRLLVRYTGFKRLKEEVIPLDAKKGYFTGLDGRRVSIPGESLGERRHLCMSGYLQNGEAIIMKQACLKWHDQLKDFDAKLVNFVHDEWQAETPNNMEVAIQVAQMMADSLRVVGEELKLKCPLAGSFWNEDLKDYTIGPNWKVTH